MTVHGFSAASEIRAIKKCLQDRRKYARALAVAKQYGVTPSQMLGACRTPLAAKARQCLWAKLYEDASSSWTMSELGRVFRRDHTTIIAGIKAHRSRLPIGGKLKVAIFGTTGTPEAKLLALTLRAKHEVLPTWHDGHATTKYPASAAVREDAWIENSASIDSADVVVVITLRGTPVTTHQELGYAIGRDKPVLFVAGPNPAQRGHADMAEQVTVIEPEAEWADTVKRIEESLWAIEKRRTAA